MAKLLTTNVYQLSGVWGTGVWGANAFLLVDNDLTLIDTGFKGRATQILQEVRQLGYPPRQIANIIITHHHVDHVGSLAALKAATPARVIAHPADAPYINGRLPRLFPAPLRCLMRVLPPLRSLWTPAPAAVDKLVNDGDELPILGGIKILHTPGHTPGSICLFLPQQRLVIAGDVLGHRFRLKLPSKAFTVDLAQEIDSIKRVASLDFDIICVGHGSPLLQNARAAVVSFTETLEKKYRS